MQAHDDVDGAAYRRWISVNRVLLACASELRDGAIQPSVLLDFSTLCTHSESARAEVMRQVARTQQQAHDALLAAQRVQQELALRRREALAKRQRSG